MKQTFNEDAVNTSAEDHIRMYTRVQQGVKSPYHLLAQYGKLWAPTIKPDSVGYGKMGECFSNALHLAHEEGLTYVEGYATTVIPMHHAWCVDSAGNVIDPTWRALGSSYFGIPFDIVYARVTAVKTGIYSILWNHGNRELFGLNVGEFHSRDFAINCNE